MSTVRNTAKLNGVYLYSQKCAHPHYIDGDIDGKQ